jgi:neurofibromin 1
MDAVAALLRGLPLQPEESDRGDLMEAKSQLFLKYFTLFMNLLNDCTDVSEIEKEVGARSRVGVAVGVGVGVGAVAVAASRLANLRNSTIQVLDIFLLFNAAQKCNRYLPNFSSGHVESPECQY